MSILDDLYPGSFRGIPFLIDKSTMRGGRKTVTHEFPNNDRRYVEDLGLNNELLSVTASVPHEVYFSRRDGLKEALDTKGYGTLVHPFYGLRNVAVISYNIEEAISDLGYVNIQIEFSVAQELLFPGSVDTDSLIGGQVEALFNTMKTGFFQSYEWVAKYAHNATSLVGALNDITNIVSSAASTFTTRSEFDNEHTQVYRSTYDTYNNNKYAYITTDEDDEINICSATTDLIEALDDISNTGKQGFDVGRKLATFQLTEPPLTTTTASQESKEANKNSLIDMMLVLAFGVTCRNAALYKITSLDDIDLLREEIDGQYLALINRVTVSDDVLQDLQDLRSNIIRYLDTQGLTAPLIQTQEVYDIPLTIFEYQQYGDLPVELIEADGTVVSRTEDLRELNRIDNPDPTSLRNTVKLYTNK